MYELSTDRWNENREEVLGYRGNNNGNRTEI